MQLFVLNGTHRQGSILPPPHVYLISYINGLSGVLLFFKAGCYINDRCKDHLMYAEDILC